MRVAIAFDHAGVTLRDTVLDAVREAGHEPDDLGTWDDYPDAGLAAGRAVHEQTHERAVVVCGSGAGISVACSKLPGIRSSVCHDTYSAAQCVEHDDVNVLCLGSRVIGPVYAADCVKAFVGAQFSGEERHLRRLGKVAAMEEQGFDVTSTTEEMTT